VSTQRQDSGSTAPNRKEKRKIITTTGDIPGMTTETTEIRIMTLDNRWVFQIAIARSSAIVLVKYRAGLPPGLAKKDRLPPGLEPAASA